MTITTSPDIGVLEVKVTFDLSGSTPVINLVNQTTVNPDTSPIPDLSTIQWVLNIYSPTGTPILQSDFDNPWKTGVWTSEQILDQWPRPFGNIEWSGADYRVEFQVKDTAGNVYDLFKSGGICRPVGNTNKSSNTFGTIDISVEVLCESASLYIKDNTSKTYKGITGILSSVYLAVDYPRDPTGVIPAPFIITSFANDALIPFSYNGKGYDATMYAIYTYDLGDNVFVVIRYTNQLTFDVTCNIDLCPLACEVKSLEESIKNGKCDDVVAAQNKLNLITPMLLRAFIAKANPACGIDLPALVEEIKALGGFNCDCRNGSTGIGAASAIMDGLLFSVNNQGGDVVASFEVTGNNVILNIKDRSYTFGACANPETSAIALVSAISGTNTNVCLQVNLVGLATDIYNTTANNATLLNLFNSLVRNGGFTLNVDGKCVISNAACDYVYTLSNIPNTPSFTQVYKIWVNGSLRTLGYSFNLDTLGGLQTYLNSLGIGTFVVADIGGGQITITSNSNPFGLGDLTYGLSPDLSVIAALLKTCASFTPLTPDEIVQALIDYLCSLDDSQVSTSQDYTVCFVNPATNLSETVVVPAGTSLTDFIIELLSRGCDTVTYLMTLTKISCASLQALFPLSKGLMQSNDFVLGTKSGECARVYPVELITQAINYGIYNQDFMTALAAAIQLNAGGKMCEPYTSLVVSTVENSPIDNKLDIIVTFSHPSAISSWIRYARIDQGGDLLWSVPASVAPGASPYTIADVDDGQYVVGITPVYADGRLCSEIQKQTSACGAITSFGAVLTGGNIVVSYGATSGKVKVNINYPNGGTFSQIYATGAGISITPPSELIGDFYVSMQPVCNESTAWFGPSTAPAIVTVNPTSNSSVVNNSSTNLGSVTVTATDINGSQLILNTPLIASGGGTAGFYIPDGFYNTITLNSLSGSLTAVSLVTVSGTYLISGYSFVNVTVENGVVITVIDSSP